MRVIERNNELLQDVQDRVITVYFLVQSCYAQASYLPAWFICQHPIISVVRLRTACFQIDEIQILFNSSVERCFSVFIINV